MLDGEEAQACDTWAEENGGNWEDYINTVLKDYNDRIENLIFYYATESVKTEIDYEEIEKMLDEIYK